MAYALTAEDKRRAQILGNQMYDRSLPAPEAAKPKGNFFTNSLSTAGGILGGIGGSLLAPGIGTAAGGAAGAGLGKYFENLLEGNKADEGVLGEAAFGTLGGIGKGFKAIKGATGALKSGAGLGKAKDILKFGSQVNPKSAVQASSLIDDAVRVPSAANKAGAALGNAGDRLLSSQSKINSSQARAMRINPVKAFGNVNKRTGLTKLDDMAEVSKGLTGGKDSMLDMLTREAVGGTNGVKIPDLRKTANDILSEAGMSSIPASQRKAILAEMTTAGTAVRGGAKGSLSTLANPQATFDQSNAFKDAASRLTAGFNPSSTDKHTAKLYSKIAKAMDDSLYKSPGVNQSIPMLTKAGADDLLFKSQDLLASGKTAQAKAYEKVALELRDVKDVAGLRKMKKDFVDIGKIDKATAQAEGTRSMTGQNVTGQIRSEIFDAVKPAVGGVANRAAQMLQGGGAATARGGMPDWAKIAGMQLGGRAATGNLPGQGEPVDAASALGDTVDPTTDLPVVPGEQSTAGMPGGLDASSALGGASSSLYTRDAVAADIQKDLAATGGENMDKYIKLYEFLNPEDGTSSKPNATTQKALSQSSNADATLQQLQDMLSQAGGAAGPVGGNVSSFFGSLGLNNNAKTYNDLVSGSTSQVARALGETGSLSDSDRAVYSNLLPKITDTAEVAAAKFAALRERMETAKQNTLTYGAGDGVAEALAAAGYDS